MLQSLFIQNYALIDTLNIQFQTGFSVITGETGAGKSIILGAIGLLLGQRADSKAMLVLVDSAVKVDFYVQDVPEVAWDLIELTDKPLTIIYSGARNLAPNLLAEDGSVGIRVTSEEFSKRLCQQFRKAIVSTSANVSGQPSPQNFSEISEEIKAAVDYIVDYRREETGKAKPSSIIKLDKGGVIKIIRQ